MKEKQQQNSLRRMQRNQDTMEIEQPTRPTKKASQMDEMLEQKRRKIQKKVFGKEGRRGESDREVFVSKPKHLFSGKSTVGKRDFR